jgi:hypothetical protein
MAPKSSGGEEEGVIDPKADALLRKMSAYVSGLKSFGVEATTVDEHYTSGGQKVQELKESKLTVQRPGQVRIDRTTQHGHATLRSDGQHFMLAQREKHIYATAPAPADLDGQLDTLRDRLQVEAPGGDLLIKDPYTRLTDGVLEGHYIALEPIGEVMAHHLFMSSKNIDWQIWIQDGPRPIPLRYVITSKDMPSHPQFTLELRGWQMDIAPSDDTFSTAPPAGAKRVEFAAPGSAQPNP